MPLAAVDFNAQRKKLKMPVDAVVLRSGVPRPMVLRILRGNVECVRFGDVRKVAGVLGLTLDGSAVDPNEMRQQEAKRKARLVAKLTQGTMGLESQAVSPEALRAIEETTIARLLAGKGRKLWST